MAWLPSGVRDRRLYPLWIAILAAAVLLPGLGSYGLWEPYEVKVADRAAEIIAASEEPPAEAEARTHRQSRSELSAELAAWGMQNLDASEGGARLPMAALALVTILCAFFIGLRVGGPRAGLIAGLALLVSPAIIFHGRHLTSEIGSVAGAALAGLGLIGLLTGKGFGFARRSSIHDVIDAILIAAGSYLGYRAAGALVGVAPAFAGVGLAAVAGLLSGSGDELPDGSRVRRAVVAALALSGAAAALLFFVGEVFDFGAAGEGDEGILVDLFGKTFTPERGYIEALGGVWRRSGDLRIGATSVLEPIAVGSFPWVGLIPIAIAAALFAAPGDRGDAGAEARWVGSAALALWALAAYVATTIFERKVGGTMFPAWAALAASVGVWLDSALPRRGEERPGLPLIALFVLATAAVVGRDIIGFADRLVSLNLTGGKLELPEGVEHHIAWVALGCAAIGALALALAARGAAEPAPGGPRWRQLLDRMWSAMPRLAPASAAVLAVAAGLALTQVVTPALSRKLSPKSTLATYQELRKEGDVLGIMGQAGGAAYYAGTEYEQIRGRSGLIDFLARSERAFALTPRNELCPLHEEARAKGVEYYVLDDSSARHRLISNRLEKGETDQNPLTDVFLREPPEDIGKPLSFNLDDQLELIGVSMPESVRRGSTFTMKLYFKVLAPVRRNWKKVFVHFDSGVRFQADHEPAGGICGTAQWVPGDIVVDEFRVTAGSRTHPLRPYRVWVGLYVGSAPNYTNMTVKSEGADKGHRIPVGTIRLR